MADDRYYLTQEKYNVLKEELENLKTVRRREVASRLEFAKSLGDLSENAEYHAAREEQADTEDRIGELEGLLKVCEIIADRHSSTIGIGSTLTVRRLDRQGDIKYRIVGPEEVDIVTGQISYLSPLGAGLLNKKKGDRVTVKTPTGETTYQITKIS